MSKAKRLRKRRAKESLLPPDSRSFELKLGRAKHHLQEVESQVEEWVNACLKTLREEPDPEEPHYYRAWIDAPDIDLQLLALRVGDCLQCLRSALDHLAFELATAFTVPMTDQIEESSEFPIVSDLDRRGQSGSGPRKWRDGARTKITGIDPDAQTLIEGLQPYQRGDTWRVEPLWVLHELNRLDKHRLLHAARWVLQGAIMPIPGVVQPGGESSRNVAAIGLPDGGEFEISTFGDTAAEGRTLVARWPMIPIDPGKEMHMGFKPVLDVVFESGTPVAGGWGVVAVLTMLNNYILSDVIPPLAAFLD